MDFSNDFFKFIKEKESTNNYEQLQAELEIPVKIEIIKNKENESEYKEEMIIIQIT